MTASLPDRVPSRTDLAWAIGVGGIATVTFAALLYASWHFAGTLFLIFAGVLFGVFLNALTELTGRLVGGPHGLRLALVCLVLGGLFVGIAFLGGNTISQQAKALSGTIKTQIVNVKGFLERNGVDTSFLELGNAGLAHPDTAPMQPRNLPSAGELASGGGAIVSQTLKLILGTIGAVGNFFIVLFLGLAFAAQPGVYRNGLVRMVPRRYQAQAEVIVGDTGDMLKRWLLAQLITMIAVFAVTAIGLSLIGIPGAFILGIQAGLLAFIPTVGAILGGLIIVLAAIGSGWIAVLSAFVLFLGVHALESYILTPLIQRQAIDIPPATLFATQILLGIVFGLWGLALALPLMAIGRVVIDHLRGEEPGDRPAPAGDLPMTLAVTPET
ncbi:putative PurR-regulated permease PerM [Rhodopseudomonas thermotolerans]|uniref:PurR-regulated permease PerM n=2 Tax=Rhodopseudomonas TaxID=1073 RepID=A0A336JH41_9BRAD|nr:MULTISPECIES: AI-2E family transporter [Rhodopseudomonas]RED42484.1 putative PurR-regulated permease PerM [Rhodopseudomonas pentothenatexigens]REG08274.1 putative PurR-regulated permease PerM [Rhodopseudomonas thermotolerans]SSW89085.1 predicted PurR-regulated permease PerM [Rhodopseudomonas pentothenatexigens]